MSVTLTLFLLVLLPFFMGIPLVIGVYVYRDAKRRSMNAVLWTLLSVFAPTLIGFLIYLLVRTGHSDLKCPRCGGSVTERFAVCPQCGIRLKAACVSCAATIESGWKVCPQCGHPVGDSVISNTPPVQRKDRWLGKILAAIVAIPIIILLLLLIGFQMTNKTGAMNTTYLTADSYLEAKAEHWSEKEYKEVELWLESCLSDPDRAYALQYETDREGQHIIQYLVFYPAAKERTSIDTDVKTTLFRSELTVDFQASEESEGYDLCTVSVYSDRAPKLSVQANGEPIEVEITSISYNLTLFEILSQ